LFFLRFWSRSKDSLFLWFAVAFWLMAVNIAVVVLFPEPDETRTWFYLIRVMAYLLMAVAIIRKNTNSAGGD
jgi:hypothetical protein